jgi:ribosomal protein L11 methyltransferase
MENKQAQSWYSIVVSAVPEAAEAVEFAFNSLEALGTEINHLQKKSTEKVSVVGYFNDLPDDESIQDELHYALSAYNLDEDSILSIERGEVEKTDWLHEWKKHWKPTEIGRFVISPPWETVEDPDKIVITIEPNMAFGTGTHETTQLCLKAIEANFNPGDSFLDVGTGTGILAIAAAKLSESELEPANIFACDTDTDSVALARENADANGLGGRIDFYEGPISDRTPQFDFVCANLTIDVILPILDLLLSKTKKTLVLSGILVEQEGMIKDALRLSELKNYSIDYAGEWIAVKIEN